MNKYDVAEYCANLIIIMDSKDSTGIPKGQTITTEYTRAYDELIGYIKKDNEDEARKRNNDTKRPQDRAEVSRSLGGSSEPDRSGTGPAPGEDVRRSGT